MTCSPHVIQAGAIFQMAIFLREAQQAGFDVMLTADKNIWHQQNHDKRMISLVVLSTNDWLVVKRSVPVILAALDRLRPGSFEEVVLSS